MTKHPRTIVLSLAVALAPGLAVAAPAAPPPPAVAPSAPPAPPAPQVHTFRWSVGFGHGRLGVHVSSMTTELRTFFGAPDDAGILVQRVEPGSAAESAGIAVGDVIVGVDGDAVDEVDDVRAALQDRAKGDKVGITVVRGKKSRKLSATMTDDPAPMPAWSMGGGSPGFVFPSVPTLPDHPDPEVQRRLDELQRELDRMRDRFDAAPPGKTRTVPKGTRKSTPPGKRRRHPGAA